MAGLRMMSGTWRARIWYYPQDGKRKEKLINLGTKDREQAEKLKEIVEEKEHKFKNGKISINKVDLDFSTKFIEIFDEFIEYKKVNDRSDRTIRLYKMAMDTLIDIYSDVNIESLTPRDYTSFLKALRERYPNNTTCNIRLKCLRTFFNWADETGRIEEVPFKIRLLPTKNKKPRYFTDEEMKMIFKEAEDDQGLYSRIYFHWKTGLRRSEFHKCYYEKGFIKTYDPIKNSKERSIPIDEETKRHFEIAQKYEIADDSVSRKFRDILRNQGLYKTRHGDRRSFHNLRNTFATRMYYITRDIFRVSVFLGHASVTTTEKYAKFDPAELDMDFDVDFENIDKRLINPIMRYKMQGQYY